MLAGLGADFAMPVHIRMALAFCSASTRKRDAGGKLRFEQLAVTNLVGPRQDAAGRSTNRSAVVVESDATDQPCDILLGKACIRAGRAGFHAGKAGFDAAADRVGMAWLLRMRMEHGSDGNGRHEYLPFQVRRRTTLFDAVGSPVA